VYGDGQQTRSFCYVDDMVTALIALMNNEETTGPVNLGNPEEYTIVELGNLIQAQINPNLSLQYRPCPSDDPRRRKPDISKAIRYLNWKPTIKLQLGLQRTIEDFQKRFQANQLVLATHTKRQKI